MRFLLSAVTVVGVFLPCGSTRADTPASAYHVIKKYPIGGEGGWDYLTADADARRLYISRFNRVVVMDMDTGEVVGQVDKTPGVHGITLVRSLNRGFSSNGQDSTVSAFDLGSLHTVARIKVGQRPDAILYDPGSEHVFTFNAGSQDATAIDPKEMKVVGAVKLGGKPEFAATDEEGKIYVNLENKNEILAIDSKELKVEHRWSVKPGEEPAGLAIDRKNHRLFSTCHNKMMVILDARTGQVLGTPAIGKGTDACIFDPDTGLSFSSNGDGTLTVVRHGDSDRFDVAANVPTQPGARTMALDSKTHRIFLVTARPKPGQRRSYEPGTFVVLVVGP